jgi:glycogen phosphorylase
MQTQEIQIQIEDDRTGLSVQTLKRAILDNLFYLQGKFPEIATLHDYYMALAYTVRDRLLQRWISTAETYGATKARTVGYLSAEFLLGPHLGNNLLNLGIESQVREAVLELGLDLEALLDREVEPGLGNGGLGRLAACYLNSLAALEIPAIGYGIRYEYGIFDQEIHNGWQVEITDHWLRYGNPWEIIHPEWAVFVKLGGRTISYTDERERYRVQWIPDKVVKGIPFDTPILGYQTNTANTLRLWTAKATESFDLAVFNSGEYFSAVREKIFSETLSKVLYPNDETFQGKQLRLEQQFFFVSCSLQDVIRTHLSRGDCLNTLHEKFALQLNDTHPAIAIAELMRLLVDEHDMEWDSAWRITQSTFGFTNHTLLPEALESYSLGLFRNLLPRHLEIIFEINRRFLDAIRLQYPQEEDLCQRVSLIDETGEQYVRMAHLACIGSHTINGVATLHTELLKRSLLCDFYQLFPEKFSNKTNGVTPRRFMVLSNPSLTNLIVRTIGDSWIKQLEDLRKLEDFANDSDFCWEWRKIKQKMKQDLAAYIQKQNRIIVNPDSLFDIQIKRIHEYKRQLLNVLHIITLYNRIKANPMLDITPRTFIFGGKAAPSYYRAKLIIKLIHSVSNVVNRDLDVQDRLKVVFLKDYNVKLGQRVYPAADLSEQISLAGKEASGTGNMKFAMNGALTIGTLDGANIEIREEVGAENFFLFGLTAEDVCKLKFNRYDPWNYYNNNSELRDAIDRIGLGYFSPGEPNLFKPLIESLLHLDEYFLLADYRDYVECQERVGQAYRDRDRWTRMSILNVARIGKFSSDRAIREYCKDIWKVESVPIDLQASG